MRTAPPRRVGSPNRVRLGVEPLDPRCLPAADLGLDHEVVPDPVEPDSNVPAEAVPEVVPTATTLMADPPLVAFDGALFAFSASLAVGRTAFVDWGDGEAGPADLVPADEGVTAVKAARELVPGATYVLTVSLVSDDPEADPVIRFLSLTVAADGTATVASDKGLQNEFENLDLEPESNPAPGVPPPDLAGTTDDSPGVLTPPPLPDGTGTVTNGPAPTTTLPPPPPPPPPPPAFTPGSNSPTPVDRLLTTIATTGPLPVAAREADPPRRSGDLVAARGEPTPRAAPPAEPTETAFAPVPADAETGVEWVAAWVTAGIETGVPPRAARPADAAAPAVPPPSPRAEPWNEDVPPTAAYAAVEWHGAVVGPTASSAAARPDDAAAGLLAALAAPPAGGAVFAAADPTASRKKPLGWWDRLAGPGVLAAAGLGPWFAARRFLPWAGRVPDPRLRGGSSEQSAV